MINLCEKKKRKKRIEKKNLRNRPLHRPFLIFVDKHGKIRYITTGDTLNVVQSNVNERVVKEVEKLPINALEEKIVQLLKE